MKKQPTPQPKDETVGITVRVPEPVRHHWNIEAKKARTSIQDAVVDCLTRRFGKPPGKP